MKRFLLLLKNEFRMFRTALTIHLIAVLQPTLMYILMAVIMVEPTFDMVIAQPQIALGEDLLVAMEQVGSPIGPPYINPILIPEADPGYRQVIEVFNQDGQPTVLQRYGTIDSNLVKNFRNRLTAAALILWNQELDSQAIRIEEHPWLPVDVPYNVYFGMAMMPLAAYLAAAMIGGYLMALEFEQGTILEYRLCPASPLLILAARITRLLITGLFAATFLYLALGLLTGIWASNVVPVFSIMVPLTLIASSIGLLAGLMLRKSLPSFLIALSSAFGFWLLGSGFGLAAGFSQTFEDISRLIPNTPTIELMFPYFYFGREVAASPPSSYLQLAGTCIVLLVFVLYAYQRRVLARQR